MLALLNPDVLKVETFVDGKMVREIVRQNGRVQYKGMIETPEKGRKFSNIHFKDGRTQTVHH